MAGCITQNWTVRGISDALENKHIDNKRIVVPMFQRGERWNKKQQQTFIDSLIKGYPVGTLLFYEKYENEQWNYILVDGLQRGSCIRTYMTNPTEFFYDENISDEVCSSIISVLGVEDTSSFSTIRSVLTQYIKEQKTFKNIQFYGIAGLLCQELCQGFGIAFDYVSVGKVTDIISKYFQQKQELYESIASTEIPVNVYSGKEDTLPEIFERINSKGTPLDQYEIYAAAWPVNEKFVIQNTSIIEYVVKKYDTLVNAGYTIHGYNREDLRQKKKVNAFEYLFGLSRYLANEFEILSFGTNISDDAVNPLAFELVNACLNDSDKIRILYKNMSCIDPNVLEKALINAINFVSRSINVITRFKGNARNSNRVFHSKYQIMSMISTTFKEMYPTCDFSKVDDSWTEKEQVLSKNLVQYYVYDIITNYWSEGGTGKIHAAAKPNRYLIPLSGRSWTVALDGFFEKSMLRSEKKSIASPRSEEYVVLNCIYVNTFTAMDQLSVDKFDVEHIAPKDQMRKLIEACRGDGLPISCIANLCYLPESANRSKGARNFYQDENYKRYVDLAEVEKKYSFTEQEDLEWMDMPYERAEDFNILKEYYTEFCTKRFKKLKQLFCESLEIQYVSSEEAGGETNSEAIIPAEPDTQPSASDFVAKCAQRLAENVGQDLVKLSQRCFKTRSGEYGFVLKTSKAYTQGEREKYWFAYRRNDSIAGCEKQFFVFGCKDESTMISLPVSLIEENLDKLNVSAENGVISHWHIVFFKDKDNHLTWMFSRPDIQEISIDDYRL